MKEVASIGRVQNTVAIAANNQTKSFIIGE